MNASQNKKMAKSKTHRVASCNTQEWNKQSALVRVVLPGLSEELRPTERGGGSQANKAGGIFQAYGTVFTESLK